MLELGKDPFDGVQIVRVFGQEEHSPTLSTVLFCHPSKYNVLCVEPAALSWPEMLHQKRRPYSTSCQVEQGSRGTCDQSNINVNAARLLERSGKRGSSNVRDSAAFQSFCLWHNSVGFDLRGRSGRREPSVPHTRRFCEALASILGACMALDVASRSLCGAQHSKVDVRSNTR
jgi:hypothetical protein